MNLAHGLTDHFVPAKAPTLGASESASRAPPVTWTTTSFHLSPEYVASHKVYVIRGARELRGFRARYQAARRRIDGPPAPILLIRREGEA